MQNIGEDDVLNEVCTEEAPFIPLLKLVMPVLISDVSLKQTKRRF